MENYVLTTVFKMRFLRWISQVFGKGMMHIFDLFISSRDSLRNKNKQKINCFIGLSA